MISKTGRQKLPATHNTVRCGIYGRKSTDEGLDREFNSLDAQRTACEAYVASQLGEGWVRLETDYSDGGFTGANMDRPGLRKLLADIEAGKIDCVVVYKVNRLSRSLLDFARLMELFDRHYVAFVSVTQCFDTASSMGRLMLNVLLSFAQFERELISERTRDKMAAARRKGMWVGGAPVLGYDLVGQKLVVNELEAERVRQIFRLYLDVGGLIPAVQELGRRGWLNKLRTTRDGRQIGGKPFCKTSLHRLLVNLTYIGRTSYKGDVFDGQHDAIVDESMWQQVQDKLAANSQTTDARSRNSFGALLKGLLHCQTCDCAMSPTHSTKNGTRRYRYYQCQGRQQHGRDRCPTGSVPAHEIEQHVVSQIKRIGSDPELVSRVIAEAKSQVERQLVELHNESRILSRDIDSSTRELQGLASQIATSDVESPAVAQLADLQDRIHRAAAASRTRAADRGDPGPDHRCAPSSGGPSRV